MWKFAFPAIKKGMDSAPSASATTSRAADTAKAEAEQALADVPAPSSPTPENESARIIEEARQQADALRRDQEQRLQAELAADAWSGPRPTSRRRRRRPSPTFAPRSPRWPSAPPSVVVQHNLDAGTQTQLVENYINQVGSHSA